MARRNVADDATAGHRSDLPTSIHVSFNFITLSPMNHDRAAGITNQLTTGSLHTDDESCLVFFKFYHMAQQSASGQGVRDRD